MNFHLFVIILLIGNGCGGKKISMEYAMEYASLNIYTYHIISYYIMPYLVMSSPGDGYCTEAFDDWLQDDPTWTHCYMQEQHTNITWFEARDNCTAKGGSLIVIYDEAIMNAVEKNAFPVPTWLGIINNNPKG